MEAWRSEVLDLLDRYLRGEQSVEAFTTAYEHWWNFQRVASQHTPEEAAWLEALFGVVAYYTPVLEDRAAYKGFKDEEAVTSAVRELRSRIGGSTVS